MKLNMSMHKSKSSNAKSKLRGRDLRSDDNSSLNSSKNGSQTRIVRPYSLGKFKSVDED